METNLLRLSDPNYNGISIASVTGTIADNDTATRLILVLDVFWRYVTDLSDGWLETGGEPVDPKREMPTVNVLGLTVPASLGAKLKKLGKTPPRRWTSYWVGRRVQRSRRSAG